MRDDYRRINFQDGSMPLIRYIVIASGFIVCSFLAVDYLIAPASQRPVATTSVQSSLADWRAAESRKSGAGAPAAIVLPAMAQMAPTAERLAFERQLASNTVTVPVFAQTPSPAASNARAEMTEAVPQQRSMLQSSNRPRRKVGPRPEVAAAERGSAQRDFGGILSN